MLTLFMLHSLFVQWLNSEIYILSHYSVVDDDHNLIAPTINASTSTHAFQYRHAHMLYTTYIAWHPYRERIGTLAQVRC